jgi:diacylglycerol O-acyltransferase
MERVAGQDAIFLSMEKPTWHQHTGGLIIYDKSEAPDFGFDALRDIVRDRIPLAARFTKRVREVPFGMDRPLWVDDPDFDVDNHMHRVALPSPGGPRELGDLVGDLMGHQLDRRMPLWEMWFIEGLEGGDVAMLAKTHHSLMDGASAQGLAEHMFDLEPNPKPSERPPAPAHKAERSPTDLELMARGLLPTMSTPFTLSRWTLQLSGRGLALLPFLRSGRRATTPMDAPSTPWNGRLSARRRLSFVSVPLDDIKEVRSRFDVKVNDVVLAIVTGALRGYLLSVEALPDRPLVCGVPISTRATTTVSWATRSPTCSSPCRSSWKTRGGSWPPFIAAP